MRIELTFGSAARAGVRPLPPVRHDLEDILAWPLTRSLLRVATRMDSTGACFLERLCETYNPRRRSGKQPLPWRLLKPVIDYALQCAKLERAVMTQKRLYHKPTGRSLALAGRSIAKYGLSAPQRFSAPLFVVWNLTRICNLRCVHCCVNPKAAPAHDELTVEEKLAVVDKLGAAGVPFLAIAGGEPLATRDIWPVLERARQRRIHVSLATNGTLLTPDVVARLIQSGVKYVEVSVDSLRPEEHDRFRGQPGAWSRAIQGIRNLVAGGMRTGLTTCLTGNTVETVDEMVEFAVRLGCRTFSHFNLISTECAGKISDGSPDAFFAMGHGGTRKGTQTLELARYVGGCGAGRWYCAVQPNGDVTPCRSSGLRVGSLRTQLLEQIWDCTVLGDLSDPDCGQNQALWDDLTEGESLVALERRPGSPTHAAAD